MRWLRPFAWLFLVSLPLLLTGCRQGPTVEVLQTEMQAKLDGKFGPGLFRIASFQRNGSFPYQDKDDPKPRLLVYFKARLTFGKDYGLGESDNLNAAVLASVLGASPGGITGIVPEGNKAGDELRVYGSTTYREEGGKWIPANMLAPEPEVRGGNPALMAAENQAPTERWLEELKQEFREIANQGKREHLQSFEHETWKARRAIHLSLDALDGRISLLSGGTASEYTAIGKSLARVANARRIPFHEYNSAGSVDNCRLVGEGKADFGITQNDIAYMAWRGEDLFEGLRPYTELQAVCGLYPEAMQIVTLAESGIESIRELAGRRVAIGSRGSGTRINAVEVLQAYGLRLEDLDIQEDLSYTGGLQALREGKVEVIFRTIAFPSRPFEELANQKPLRLLPIEDEIAERLVAERPFLRRLTIPRGTYHDLEIDVPTLGVTATLVTHSEVPAERVEKLMGLLFDSSQEIQIGGAPLAQSPRRAFEHYAEGSSMASFISRTRGAVGISIPFHPAAARNLGIEGGSKSAPSP